LFDLANFNLLRKVARLADGSLGCEARYGR
jgi:hypothetical protein